jgi:hypothetical protein
LRAIDWKMLIYFMAIWNILSTFGEFYDHLVNFVLIWYIFPVLVSRTNKNLAILFWPVLTHEARYNGSPPSFKEVFQNFMTTYLFSTPSFYEILLQHTFLLFDINYTYKAHNGPLSSG